MHPPLPPTDPLDWNEAWGPREVEALIGPGAAVEVARPRLVSHGLYPEEQAYIARAAEKRRAEFGAARLCARRALARLGLQPTALVPNPDRSPRWPEGVVGSISHTDDCCIVAVARRDAYASIGVDVEGAAPLGEDILTTLCTPDERSWLDAQPPPERAVLGVLFFSAKEAFYKCQYPLTKRWLDFQDVEIRLDPVSARFSVRASGAAAATARRVTGRYARLSGHVVAAAILPAA